MTPFDFEYPEPAKVERLLRQYAPVQLEAHTRGLSEGDRLSLHHLVDAARWIDRIYWQQRSEFGWTLKQRLSASPTPVPATLHRLVDLSFGPWDVFDNDRPFWGDTIRPPGGSHYPPDLTRDEIDRYLDGHGDERAALLSPTTQIRRDGSRLVPLPYASAFHEELAHIADALVRASNHATHAGFARFLRARAEGLRTGELSESEACWMEVGDSPIDIAIGPYEVYDDELLGLKASYEATVMVRHPMSDDLSKFEAIGADLAPMLPGAVAAPHDRQRIIIGVYDVIFVAGSTNKGAKATAAMLPNDEKIRRAHGSRLLLFQNVIAAKFTPILKPLAERLLRPAQAALVRQDAFVMHTLLHEMAHALIAGPEAHAAGPTANQRLRERYSTIEECRADLVGLVFLDQLARRGVIPTDLTLRAAVTLVAGSLRVLRFGSDNDYGRAAAIILSHLLRAGAIDQDGDDRLCVDVSTTLAAVRELAGRVQSIVTGGRYEEAGALIQELGSVPPRIAGALTKLDGLPVDLQFAFDASLTG